MRIIPAILTGKVEELDNQINNIREMTDEVDIDIMDGDFVSDKSINIEDLKPIAGLQYNLDLMVRNPQLYIEAALNAKETRSVQFGRVFIHVESAYDLSKIIELCRNKLQIGFSLDLTTAIENFIDVYNKAKALDNGQKYSLQLKTVQIGKQGNPYHPEALAKIDKARKEGFNGDIFLDGGIDPEIIMTIRKFDICGVSVGSYISHSSDPMRSFQNLRDATWKKSLD